MRLFPKRRWLRFSLRFLFILAFIIAVWVNGVRQRIERENAFRSLLKIGALADVDFKEAKHGIPVWHQLVGDRVYLELTLIEGSVERDDVQAYLAFAAGG